MDTQLQQLELYRQQATKLVFPSSEGIEDQIAALELEYNALTPIEDQHGAAIRQRILELKLSVLGFTETLPYEPLRLRNEQGQPIFAIYNVMKKNPVFCLEVRADNNHQFQVSEPSEMPPSVRECFQDMDQHLRNRIPKGPFGGLLPHNSSMSSRYMGLIPQTARDKIKAVKPLFENVYLIAEAPAWEYKVEPAPRPIPLRDPLVVGFGYRRIYLITSFDTTTPEQVFLDSAKTGS